MNTPYYLLVLTCFALSAMEQQPPRMAYLGSLVYLPSQNPPRPSLPPVPSIQHAQTQEEIAAPDIRQCKQPNCKFSCKGEYQMRQHVNGTHLKTAQYKCFDCERVYATESTLRTHLKSEIHQFIISTKQVNDQRSSQKSDSKKQKSAGKKTSTSSPTTNIKSIVSLLHLRDSRMSIDAILNTNSNQTVMSSIQSTHIEPDIRTENNIDK